MLFIQPTSLTWTKLLQWEKTDKKTILKAIYDDYDYAASVLPNSYASSVNMHATKGAALAMKSKSRPFL